MPDSQIQTLGDIIERNRTLHASVPAIRYGDLTITYGEFGTLARKLANALYELGARRQDRIAILAQNSPEYIVYYAACELAGFIAVPINYRLARPEVMQILRDSEPAVFLFEEEYADIAAHARAELPAVRHHVLIGESGPDWALRYDRLVGQATDEAPPITSRPDDIVHIVYTSGTTGRPKGAMLDHRAQVGFIQWHALELNSRPGDRIVLVMPFYHIGSKCNQMAYSLRAATVVLHRNYDIVRIAQSIEREKATVAHLAPIMVQDLLNVPDVGRYDFSSLHTIQYASGPMPVAQLKRAVELFGPIFMQVYGMTETGSGTVLHAQEHLLDGSAEQVRRLGSAGKAALGYEVRVVDGDGIDCEPEERGEILITGPGVMRGYWNNSAASLSAVTDGWMHTGDIGFFDEDRYLFIVDRKKDMIVSGGENIYPREVEEVLYSHPGVAEAAVIGVPDPRWGEAVKAFVVTRPDAAPGEAELIEHCREHIASYKKPKSIEFVEALPRLANKKVDKKLLRAGFWDSRERSVV